MKLLKFNKYVKQAVNLLENITNRGINAIQNEILFEEYLDSAKKSGSMWVCDNSELIADPANDQVTFMYTISNNANKCITGLASFIEVAKQNCDIASFVLVNFEEKLPYFERQDLPHIRAYRNGKTIDGLDNINNGKVLEEFVRINI